MTPMAITIEPTLTHPHASDHAFGRLETARGCLPLAALDVAARVTALEVATELRQTFVNHTGAAIEATYIFPLPDRAAVHRFRMEVRGRVVEGVIDERGRARDIYDQALAAGRRAAIAEEDRPGVFTLRVGNLMPGEHATITLGMVGPLPVEDGEVTYAFPLVVAPRYMPGAPLDDEQAGTGVEADTDRVPDASRISPPVLLPGFSSPVRLSLTVHVDGAGLPITRLRSSLHEVHAAPEGSGWRVELRPGEHLDRDFILRWTLGDANLRSSAVWAADADGEGATAMVTLVPPVGAAAQGRARDVVLVLDRSGSMGGWKMVAARRAAAPIVDTLGERDRFAVLAFDDTIDAPPGLGAQLVAGGDRNRFRAVEFLAGIQERGGTELAQPLELAAQLLAGRDERDHVLVLVTDGQVGNEDEILRRLAPRLTAVRVFTLGIDQAVNAAFLRRLASVGGGACELVESEDRLDQVMAKIHRRIATPVLSDVSLTGDGLDLATLAPRRLPAVFAGAPLVVRVRLRGRPRPGATFELRGRLPAGTEYVERIKLDSAHPGAALAQSWARAHIRDLEDQYAARTSSQAELERAIVAVSLRHRVLSRFTAFVAVDREIVHRGGPLQTITQPVEAPAGWRSEALGLPAGGMLLDADIECLGTPAAAPAVMSPSAGTGPGPVGLSAGTSAGAPPTPILARMRISAAAPSPATRAPAPQAARAPAPQASRPTDAHGHGGPPLDAAPYVARLLAIADDLARAATAATPTSAAQLPVARLIELLEDLRTVELDAMARELAPIVDRLRAALTATDLVTTLHEAVAALRRLPTDADPSPEPPETRAPAKKRRSWAFWR